MQKKEKRKTEKLMVMSSIFEKHHSDYFLSFHFQVWQMIPIENSQKVCKHLESFFLNNDGNSIEIETGPHVECKCASYTESST